MAHLFSQIPAQVMNKMNIYKFPDDEDGPPIKKKKVKFQIPGEVKFEPAVAHEDSSTDVESPINIDDDSNEPTFGSDTRSKKGSTKPAKEYSDAIIQTETKKTRTVQTQTDESMTTRPLDDDDVHRFNMQTFAPIRPLPRNRSGYEPPLKIGMTIPRGRKRKVFYPGEDDSADGA